MKKALKKKWVAALRSGKYKQGKGYLKQDEKDGSRYCCLGVLCELQKVPINAQQHYPATGFQYESGLREKGQLIGDSKMERLAIMNDGGKRFSTIANWIEKNL